MSGKMKVETAFIDPPSGWQFGFPKVFDFKASCQEKHEEELIEWFLKNGYPQAMIDQGMHKYCRYWTKEIEIDTSALDGEPRADV